MKPQGADLLTPSELEGIRGLELAARVLARAYRTGGHPSPFTGAGEDFERHRPYQQGDDLRHLDWRLYARSDRLHLRRYRERAAHPTWLLVDRSPSMAFSQGERVSKLRWSTILAAAVGHILLEGGDPVGLASVGATTSGDVARVHLPLRARPGHRAQLFQELDALRPGAAGGAAPEAGARSGLPAGVQAVLEQLPRSGRLILFSDLLVFDHEAEALVKGLGVVRARGGEATVVRVADPAELGLEPLGVGPWVDPEGSSGEEGRLRGAPDAGFPARVEAHYTALGSALRGVGVEVVLLTTDQPLLDALHRWLGEG